MPDDSLEAQFHDRMIQIYKDAKKEEGYNATRFLAMLAEPGSGLAVAKGFLRSPNVTDGFTTLVFDRNRPDLTVEAVALEARWSVLFTKEELAVARERLGRA